MSFQRLCNSYRPAVKTIPVFFAHRINLHYVPFTFRVSYNTLCHQRHVSCLCGQLRFKFMSSVTSRQVDSYDLLQDNDILSENRNIFYQEFEFNNDDDLQNIVCPKLYEDSNDSVLQSLSESRKIKDIFKIINNCESNINIQQAIQALISLSTIKVICEQNKFSLKYYGGLNIYDMDEMNSKLKSFGEFNKVLDVIENNVTSLSNSELSSVFTCLNHLEMKLHDSVMMMLHLHLIKCIPSMDLVSLTRLSFAFRNQGLKAYFTQSKILTRFVFKMDDWNSLNDLQLISLLLVNMKRLVSRNVVEKYFNMLQNFVDNDLIMACSPGFKILLLKNAHVLSKTEFPVKLCKALTLSLLNDISQLTAGQIITINKSLLKQLEPRNFQIKLQEHASRIFDDYKDMEVQTDLLLCLTSQTTLKNKDLYEAVSLQKLLTLQEHGDILSLSRILRFIKMMDFDFRKRLWNQAMNRVKQYHLSHQQSDQYLGGKEKLLFSVYGQYIMLTSQLRGLYRCKEIENELLSLIEEELNGPSQLIPTKFAQMAGFLLAFSDNLDLMEKLLQKLVDYKRQLNYYDIIFLSRCIKCSFSNKHQDKAKMRIIAKACKLLDEVTESVLKNAVSLNNIAYLTRAYLSRQSSPATELFDRLADSHLKYLNQLNSPIIISLIMNFKVICYSSHEINEAISNYIIENDDSVFPRVIYQTLSYLYSVGYYPVNCEEFTTACRRALEMTYDKMDCLLVLESCLALCFLKNLSPELIHYIFNIKFMDRMEEEIYSAASVGYSTMMRSLLMKLNRAVCLDHPELKIPWFHENYCKEHCDKESSYFRSDFHREVHDILHKILGGDNIISVNRKSPYYYNLDLEFGLASNGKPIPLYERKFRNSKLSSEANDDNVYKKVAVQLRDDKSYCINSSAMTGPCQLERRHLEILGYAVVEVCQHSWHSMALTADDDKAGYLKQLIYDELSRMT